MSSPTVDDLFNLLDRWRHLPAYRLEPRADPFFALFLPEVLETHLKKQKGCSEIRIDPRIIPEFPLKKDNNQSKKVDYVAFTENPEKVFLIELKTDLNSITPDQIKYLREAKNKDIGELISEVLEIIYFKNESPKLNENYQKYIHLLDLLSKLEYVCFPNRSGLMKKAFAENPEGRRGTGLHIADIKKLNKKIIDLNKKKLGKMKIKPEVIFILPDAGKDEIKNSETDFDCIGFEEFASCVKKQDGDISKIFAKYLDEWITPAGSIPPGR